MKNHHSVFDSKLFPWTLFLIHSGVIVVAFRFALLRSVLRAHDEVLSPLDLAATSKRRRSSRVILILSTLVLRSTSAFLGLPITLYCSNKFPQ